MIGVKESVFILEKLDDADIIVFIREKNITHTQINEHFDYLIQISSGKKFHLIVDLTQAPLPDAEMRSLIKVRFKLLKDSILSYRMVVGKNYLIKVAIKFVAASVGLANMTAYESIINAKKAILNGH